MRPLRILHVTPYSADAWAYGGIPRLAATLTRDLSRRGHLVTVCTTDVCHEFGRLPAAAHSRAHRFRAWPASRTIDGTIVRVFPNLSNHAAYNWQAFAPVGLGGYLRRHAGDFDVAHIHACRNLPGAIAARHLRRAGVPFVLAPNGTAPNIERRHFAKRVFDATVGRHALRAAACVLAVSDSETRQLRALGVPDRAMRLIPNPVDLDEFAHPILRGQFRRSFGLERRPVVLFLGKITPRKRVDVLVRAFASIARTDAVLVIAGNDMGGADEARALAASLGVANRTMFTGLLTGAARLEALADATVVVYASQHEIFGLVPLEALLAGTSVIVADDSGCGDLIGDIRGGQVVPAGDAAALTGAIDAVLAAPEAWRAASADAAARVRARFGAASVGPRLVDLYRQLIDRESTH